jgi:hypothetical protein
LNDGSTIIFLTNKAEVIGCDINVNGSRMEGVKDGWIKRANTEL